MPAARSSSGRSSGGAGRKSGAKAKSSAGRTRKPGGASGASAIKRAPRAKSPATPPRNRGVTDGFATLAEQLVNRVLLPLDAVLLTRGRIQETLEEAAARGRITRSDADDLVSELFQRGRQQTDDMLGDVDRLLESAKRARTDSVDLIVRGADRARRTVGVGPVFPILAYDELTAGQVEQRLTGLKPAELRRVRDYEKRHANRKSVLAALERALA